MQTLVNCDKTIAVDLSLKRFVKDETERILARFAGWLTRVEVHLNDVNNTEDRSDVRNQVVTNALVISPTERVPHWRITSSNSACMSSNTRSTPGSPNALSPQR
jgi:hypothetical protein